jgi:hypothetical protein
MCNKKEFYWQETKNYHEAYEVIIMKFRLGESITDYELRLLLTHYLHLEKLLYVEGQRFYFAWKDASDQVSRLIDMQVARQKAK